MGGHRGHFVDIIIEYFYSEVNRAGYSFYIGVLTYTIWVCLPIQSGEKCKNLWGVIIISQNFFARIYSFKGYVFLLTLDYFLI